MRTIFNTRQRNHRLKSGGDGRSQTGGARRTWLHGLEKTQKRYLATVTAHNLGIVMRKLFGIGKPRTFAAGWASVFARLAALRTLLTTLQAALTITTGHSRIPAPLRSLFGLSRPNSPHLSLAAT